MRFQPLHNKVKEILEKRDKVRQTLYDTSENRVVSDVIVLPTKEELEQESLPVDLPSNITHGPYPNAIQYLDIQYRLLREDFIHPLRCALHEIEGDEEEDYSTRVYHDVTIKSEVYSSYDCAAFEISFQGQNHHQVRWDRSKRFTYGDLVCLMNDDRSIILFATVIERNIEDLRRGIVTVEFRTEADIMQLPPIHYHMIESPGFYAGYAPILRHIHALQEHPDSLPFSQYIVELETDVQLPQYISDESEFVLNLHTAFCNEEHPPGEQPLCAAVNILDEGAWNNLPAPNLDNSQKKALQSALTQELAVIQGPPGTGKTYIGLKIVETLLKNRSAWDRKALALGTSSTIVVVCYTNHALDQFLEEIIKQKGITIDVKTQVRRVGGRSKSQVMKEHNINTFVRNHLHARGIFGFWRKKNSKIVQQIGALNDLLKRGFDPHKVKVYSSLIGTVIRLVVPFLATRSSKEVAHWLGFHSLEDSAVKCPYHDAEDARKIADDDDEDNDDILETFGRDQLHNFFEMVAKVEPLTEERAYKVVQPPSLTIEPFVGCQLFKYGLHVVKRELEEMLNTGKVREEEYEDQRRMAMLHCLQEADIIGLTTTGAAKYNSLLSEIDAKIVIVEEAAEVLEAHIVSSVSHKTQHLILIGDHKQLRPKTNDHTLARDHHLDVSLFERLVTNEFPCVTLSVQHRMRPEISALVSSTIYQNALIDAPSTEIYPPIKGMQHNVFFVDHFGPEISSSDLKSKANNFEAQFLARLCKYLLQQCTYSQEQITVITPYTGQMFHMRDEFEQLKMPKVRITPIDSYQGEENDIILLSLVRSKKPGFVKSENRICVAMSRAKHGFYVIGNFSQLFVHTSKLWRSLVGQMKSQGKFATCLPLKCQGHEIITPIHTLEDFETVSHGGCSSPCNSRLPCNHMCPFKCHPDPDVHSTIKCMEKCPRSCVKGHRCKYKCHKCKTVCRPCEEIVDKIIPTCGHEQKVPCHLNPARFTCPEPCTKILSCGHKCKKKCGEPHTSECQKLVPKVCPNKHEGKAECYITGDSYSRKCKAPCGEILMCGHLCKGTCGECHQGRLHKPCTEKCDRPLTCGHDCASPCAQNCPPCKKKCLLMCTHGPCDHKCFELCRPCSHDCECKCEHQACTHICGELCDCNPCNEPCPKKLPCMHDCMGLCGEECPDVCRICNKDNFNDKVPLIFGTEDPKDSPDLRIIMLDCRHMFSVESMDKYLQSDQNGKIQWKCCFLCKVPIFKTNRYKDLVVQTREDLNKIKEKELVLMPRERRTYEMELRDMVQSSSLIKNPDKIIKQIKQISDKQLQAEYTIFSAEKRTTKAIKELDAVVTMQSIQHSMQRLCLARDTLVSQTKYFLLRLETYRRLISMTEQVQHDVRAEQHRIQLLSAVLTVKSQIKAKYVTLNSTDQENLEEFMTNYEVRCDKVCKLKMTQAEYDSSMIYMEDLQRRHPEITGITQKEKQMIHRALGAKPGSWYKCRNGHYYNIGECGGAMEEAKCPECKSTIGGSQHRLRADNTHAGDFDGSQHAAWSTGANLANYDLQNLF